MITVIDIGSRTQAPTTEGHVRNVLGATETGTRVSVAVREVDPGKTYRCTRSDRTQVIYILDGTDATLAHTSAGKTAERQGAATRRHLPRAWRGSDRRRVGTPLKLLVVTVPKHTGRAGPTQRRLATSSKKHSLRSLIDEKQYPGTDVLGEQGDRPLGSWDLQLGRMQYAPRAHSPRHVHHASKTSPVTPEHFYLIEKGTGEVKHDTGSLSVRPRQPGLIPAGEWHQLIASDTGFDYIEFQAPFDFATTMDHDPLGEELVHQGTDDGTGKPKLWVQS